MTSEPIFIPKWLFWVVGISLVALIPIMFGVTVKYDRMKAQRDKAWGQVARVELNCTADLTGAGACKPGTFRIKQEVATTDATTTTGVPAQRTTTSR